MRYRKYSLHKFGDRNMEMFPTHFCSFDYGVIFSLYCQIFLLFNTIITGSNTYMYMYM